MANNNARYAKVFASSSKESLGHQANFEQLHFGWSEQTKNAKTLKECKSCRLMQTPSSGAIKSCKKDHEWSKQNKRRRKFEEIWRNLESIFRVLLCRSDSFSTWVGHCIAAWPQVWRIWQAESPTNCFGSGHCPVVRLLDHVRPIVSVKHCQDLPSYQRVWRSCSCPSDYDYYVQFCGTWNEHSKAVQLIAVR